MDRLHALDAGFLHLEDGISHMHLGGMSIFDGSPPSEEALCGLLDQLGYRHGVDAVAVARAASAVRATFVRP